MVIALILLVIFISFPHDVVALFFYNFPRLGRIIQSFLYHCNMLSVSISCLNAYSSILIFNLLSHDMVFTFKDFDSGGCWLAVLRHPKRERSSE